MYLSGIGKRGNQIILGDLDFETKSHSCACIYIYTYIYIYIYIVQVYIHMQGSTYPSYLLWVGYNKLQCWVVETAHGQTLSNDSLRERIVFLKEGWLKQLIKHRGPLQLKPTFLPQRCSRKDTALKFALPEGDV